ncbi:MAG: DUF4230 domain-containing protein [Sphingomonas sp.]|uniref:DUF4230 domain-containing protein n=1 Tax=Sphingomonas sp. TaxID=28214 RepID=UPI001AD3FB90|nr:DUF4230 domain-containing protein [Sphingomonas sp.]MBN8807076.1 DUF4230 domain-containing protein [Sphingomonas sp.]
MAREHVGRGDAANFLVKVGGGLALVTLFLLGGLWLVSAYIKRTVDPSPVTIASASVQGLREQNKLSAFQASFVAVVTSKQTQLGLSTDRTIIMPGTVDYSVDLANLRQRDVVWDAKTKTLGVTLPPVTASPPRIDLNAVRYYGHSGILGTFTSAGEKLDAINRDAGQKELTHQALQPETMKLARDATRRAVERSFALPLKAAGITATVRVRFADEGVNDEVWDMSKPIDGVDYSGR